MVKDRENPVNATPPTAQLTFSILTVWDPACELVPPPFRGYLPNSVIGTKTSFVCVYVSFRKYSSNDNPVTYSRKANWILKTKTYPLASRQREQTSNKRKLSLRASSPTKCIKHRNSELHFQELPPPQREASTIYIQLWCECTIVHAGSITPVPQGWKWRLMGKD